MTSRKEKKEKLIELEDQEPEEDVSIEEPKPKKKKDKKPKQETIPICGIFKLKYYRQYFQATTTEVMKKLFWSVIFFRKNFNEVAEEKTDL